MTDEEIQLLAERHTSLTSIAQELTCSRERIRRLCDRAGVVKFKTGTTSLDLLPAWIITLLSSSDIAKLLTVPQKSLLGRRHFAHQSLHFRVQRYLVKRLWNEKWTVREISDSLELTATAIYSIVSAGRNKRGLEFDRRYVRNVS